LTVAGAAPRDEALADGGDVREAQLVPHDYVDWHAEDRRDARRRFAISSRPFHERLAR
jgi:hypothetical protein